MQVLIVLARAKGAVVSRDTLVQTCWGGRIVDDNAISRIISLLRGLASRSGAFEIETMSRVGYRLVETPDGTKAASATPSSTAPPRRRWSDGVGSGLALLVIIGVVAWAWQARTGMAPRPPEVEVEPFAVSGTGLPNTFAADVREEMLTVLPRGAPDMTLKAVEPGQRPTTFRLRGRIEANGGLVSVYARLEPPDGSRILWSSHYEIPLARAKPDTVSQDVVSTVGCIMGLYEGDGGPGLSSPAMAPWSDYCTENVRVEEADGYRELSALRRTVAIAPDFARADAMLGLFVAGAAVGRPPAEKKALTDEGLAAAGRAERVAPKEGWGYMAEAVLRQDSDPVRAEQLFIKATTVGARTQLERQAYAGLLEHMGRIDDAIDQHERLLAVQPNNPIDMGRLAKDEARKGRYAAAKQLLDKIDRLRIKPGSVTQLRLQVAFWARDWATVRGIVGQAPSGPVSAYVDALASGDKARIDGAGGQFEGLAAYPAQLRPFTAEALALTGRPQAALAVVSRLAERAGPGVLSQLYDPPFAEARRTPEFEALATRYGLVDYWRRSGRKPDFCTEPNPPSMCGRLGPLPTSQASASAGRAAPG
jgi:hypothetical protein